MPLRVVREAEEKEVTFLKGVDVEFVSLVRHGANQMPFRVIKSTEKGGDNKAMMIVQSILMPKSLNASELAGKEELAWLADANLKDGRDFDVYRKFDQSDLDDFLPESLRLAKVHEDGVWALVGAVKEDKATENRLALGGDCLQKVEKLETAPMDMSFGPAAAATVQSFRDLFYKELDSMLSVVTGVLNQSSADPKKRKSSIMTAVEAFRSFLGMGLDALGDEAAKIGKAVVKTTEKEPEMEKLFESKEEFVASVKEILTELVPGMIQEKADQFKQEAEKTGDATPEAPAAKTEAVVEEVPKDDPVQKLTETVAGLVSKMEDLSKKWDNSPATIPAATEPDEAKNKDKAKVSVFSGLLVPGE